MAGKLKYLLPFLLLLAFQEMMIRSGESASCEAPSRLFKGFCFSRKNCGAICEKEGFLFGQCRTLRCICVKDCGIGGGDPGQGPPSEGPPEQDPPGEDPPEEGPPSEDPPEEGPPSGGDGSKGGSPILNRKTLIQS